MLRKKFHIISFLILLASITIALAPGCMTFRSSDASMADNFREKGIALQTGYHIVKGRKLHYAITGKEELPTILFIHGSPGSWSAFENYLQDSSLLHTYRMIAIDRPGFGYSDFGNVLHLKEQSALIGDLIRHRQNGHPFYIAGHSMGGPVAIQLAADHPEWIAGLIILAGSIDPALEKPEKWRPFLISTPLRFLVPGALRASNEELWFLKEDLVELKNDFSKVTCPVYFIHGEKDSWVPPGNVEYGKKMLVNASAIGIQWIPDANHFIPWNKYSTIRDFLLSLPAAVPSSELKTSQ